MEKVRNLLIFGGCHFMDDGFISNIKQHYEYLTVKKVNTHIAEENFLKNIQLLSREKDYLKSNNFDIYIQLGNRLFRNSIMQILPGRFKEYFLSKVETYINRESNASSIKFNKSKLLLYLFTRKIFKLIIFPFNFLYIPIKGFMEFRRVKKILIFNHYYKGRIVLFTPFDSPKYTDKFFVVIGKIIIYHLFQTFPNIQIIDSSSFKYDKRYWMEGDIYHLNKNGIKLLSNFCIEKIK